MSYVRSQSWNTSALRPRESYWSGWRRVLPRHGLPKKPKRLCSGCGDDSSTGDVVATGLVAAGDGPEVGIDHETVGRYVSACGVGKLANLYTGKGTRSNGLRSVGTTVLGYKTVVNFTPWNQRPLAPAGQGDTICRPTSRCLFRGRG